MARGLDRSEAQTGTLMTVYAWIVALLSLPLTAYTAGLNRRLLMLYLLGIFVVAHALVVVTSSFEMLVVSRALVASAHAIFWGIATPLAIRLAPQSQKETAMSVVATGATLGGVLGIPLGTMLGQINGWRLAFGAIGIGAAVVMAILIRFLPSTPSLATGSLKSIRALLQRKRLLLVYLLTVILMTGHYTAFTFISPYLQHVGQWPQQSIASVLLVFGCAGLLGGFFSPLLLRKKSKLAPLAALALVGICLLMLRFAVMTQGTTILLVVVWGVAFTFFNLVLQSLVLTLAPDAEDVAMAGFSGIYNIGIGGGALIGSLSAATHLSAIGFFGGGLVFVAFFVFVEIIKRS